MRWTGVRALCVVVAFARASIAVAEDAAPRAPAPAPPAASAPSTPPGAPAAEPESPAPPPPPDPIDVSIHEPLKPPDTVSLTRAEVRLIPGTFGDPFRVVESLPGVVPIASGVPYFYVRGAPPANVGYFLDGIRIPLLFHLGLGPSVLHPDLIDSVQLHPGGTPEIGRFSGGSVTAQLAEPRDEIHFDGSIRVIDSGAFLEVPFDHGKGSAMAAGRFSYTAALFSALQSDTHLDYGDYAARVSYAFDSNHRLSIFAFGAYDYLGRTKFESLGPPVDQLFEIQRVETLFDTTFHRIDVRYDQRASATTTLRHDIILGWDQTHLDEGRGIIDRMLEARSTLRYAPNDDLVFTTGLDTQIDGYDVDLFRPGADDGGFSDFFKSRVDVAVGAFGQLAIRLGDHFEITPAVRADLYVSNGISALGIDPSVSIRIPIDEHWAFETSHGLSSQMPSFILPGPAFRPALDANGLQRSFMSSAGFVYKPDRSWTFKATVYRQAFFDINDSLGTSTLAGDGFPDGLGGYSDRFTGHAEGLELSAQRRLTKQIGVIAAYSIGRSERFGAEGEHVPSGFDRTHVATAAVAFDFTHGWHGGVKNVVYSGAPILEKEPLPASPLGQARFHVFALDHRQSPFFRTDLRLEKRWSVLQKGHVSLVFEMLNTFLAQEVIGTKCSATGPCTEDKIGPVVVPSIGVEGGF